ncbi:MAG: hypothetical protein EOP56_02155 [Sphingobacteriales bacterium]|nr:MAG: hypothetical protein EOP56_02155 [Sphingobacteriales bacterium]
MKSKILQLPKDYDYRKSQLAELIKQEADAGTVSTEIDKKVDESISNLKSVGWQRKHILYFLHDMLNNSPDLYSTFDTLLLEIDSGLTGNCDLDYVDRFPGDPIDKKDFAFFVRTFKWLE